MKFSIPSGLAWALLSTQVDALVAYSYPTKVPKGFVTTDGTKFKVDGKDFYFAGSNAYYFPFNNVSLCCF